ncbi:hypothetical protein FACS1894200_08520 [Spirochaetia bacterium]|nr:hypothetical protein FACS1894200_08520 [Spirochaetia bacterium]
MAGKKELKDISFKLQFTLFFIFLIIGIFAIIILAAYEQSSTMIEAIATNVGYPVVERARNTINGFGFERYVARIDTLELEPDAKRAALMRDPFFVQNQQLLLTIKRESACLYLYTCALLDNDTIQYVIDGSGSPTELGGFSFPGDLDMTAGILQPIKLAQASKEVQISNLTKTPYGWMVTVIAPILTPQRDVVGFVAADFSAETLYADMQQRLLMQVLLTMVFIAISLIVYNSIIDRVNRRNEELVALKDTADRARMTAEFSATELEAALAMLKDTTIEKGEYLTIFANVKDGLFLLDTKRCILPYYSASMEKIFMRSDLSGLDIREFFAGIFDKKVCASVGDFFDVAFDPAISWRNVEKLNPLMDVAAYFDNNAGSFTEKHLQFTFTRLAGTNGDVERLFGIVHDATEKKILANEIEKTKNEAREEMEMLQHFIHIEPEILREFFDGVRSNAEAINDELRGGGELTPDQINVLFRRSHAIKGDAQLLSLDFLADKAEELEQRIAAIPKENVTPDDYFPLTIACSKLMKEIDKLDTIGNKWFKLSGASEDHREKPIIKGAESLQLSELAHRFAKNYGKDIDFTMSGFDTLKLNSSKRKTLSDIFIQLIRNSVYHGIEDKETRQRLGKGKGQLSIAGSIDAEKKLFTVLYKDDGGGLDIEKIRRKLLKEGILPPDKVKALERKDLVMYIFNAGFSTADKPDKVAGKGIGMSLVMEKVKELGGKVSIKSRPGEYCAFILTFPLAALTE